MPGVRTMRGPVLPEARSALKSDPRGVIARVRSSLGVSQDILRQLLKMPSRLWSGRHPALWRPFQMGRTEGAERRGEKRGIGDPGMSADPQPPHSAGLAPGPNGTGGALRLRAGLTAARLSRLLPAPLREPAVKVVLEPLFREIRRNGPDADWAGRQLVDWVATDAILSADLEKIIRLQWKGMSRDMPGSASPGFRIAMQLMTEMPWQVRDLIREQLRTDNFKHDGREGTYPATPWYRLLHSAVLAGRAEAVQVLAPLVEDPVHFLGPLVIDSMSQGVNGTARQGRRNAVMAAAAHTASADTFYPWLERQLATPTADGQQVSWRDDLLLVRATWFVLGNEAAYAAELADSRGGDLRALDRLIHAASMPKIGVNHQKARQFLMEEKQVEQFTWLIATAEGRILIQRLEKLGQSRVRDILIVRGDISGLHRPDGHWDVEGLTGFAEMGSPQALGKLLELDPNLPSEGRQMAFDPAIHNYVALNGQDSTIGWLAELGFNAAQQLLTASEKGAGD